MNTSVPQNYILHFIAGKILLLQVKLRNFNYLNISLIPIHKTCSSCNLTYPASGHCREICGQSSIREIRVSLAESNSVHFLQKYEVTVVFAVPLCKKTPNFYGSVAARQVPVAYRNVKKEQKGSSL